MKRRRRSQQGRGAIVALLFLAVVAWCGVLWSAIGADAAKIVKVVVAARNLNMVEEFNAAIDWITNQQLIGSSALNIIWVCPAALIVFAIAFSIASRGNR